MKGKSRWPLCSHPLLLVPPYRLAVWRGEPRRNLDGSEAGAPTVEQRNDAGRSFWGARYQAIVERDEPTTNTAAAAD